MIYAVSSSEWLGRELQSLKSAENKCMEGDFWKLSEGQCVETYGVEHVSGKGKSPGDVNTKWLVKVAPGTC